jgi:hypothetical protein
MYVIDLLFDDGNRTKYVVSKNNFYEAKTEAKDIKDSWNFSNRKPSISGFLIKEIKNEDSPRKQSSDNSRPAPKSKVRKHYLESDEEYS